MFYSAQTGGFYDRAIHGDNIPADAVEITREEWLALLAGQAEGKMIVAGKDGKPELQDPPPPQPIVPAQVTRRQAKLALHHAGLLKRVESAIAEMPEAEREVAEIEWNEALHIERHASFTEQMAAVLGLSSADLDALFIAAEQM